MATAEEEDRERRYHAAGLGESLAFYAEFVKGYWADMIWGCWLHAIDILPLIVLPIITMVIVDYFIPSGNKWAIVMALPVVLVILIVNTMHHVAFQANTNRALAQISRALRNKIIERLQLLSLSYHSHQQTGRYYSKLTSDVDRIEGFGHMCLNIIVQIIIFGGFSLATLLYVNWEITLIVMAITPVFQIIVFVFRKRMRFSRHLERLARENLSASVGHFLQASLLARQHGVEQYESEKIAGVNEIVSQKTVDAEADVSFFSVVNTFSSVFFHFIIIAICAHYVINDKLTFGGLLLFTSCAQRVIDQINAAINMTPVINQFTESVGSIKEIITSPDIEDNVGKKQVGHIDGRITFDNVSFAYDGSGRAALHNVSVDIAPGTTVGLVGKSGSGKSTFVNLALGLYRTQDGAVKIDGMPVNDLDMRSVRLQVGVVSQTPVLFSGTVFDNIVHAYTDTPFEAVIDAARKANAHDFICQLDRGYDTEVGEKGVLLSGGQKQRIALARTILRKPALLVLDEATSALDTESERLVQAAIDHLDQKMTKLIIAHRLSTIRGADLILVFNEGEIVERGTHEELLAKNGYYAELLRYQSLNADDPMTTYVARRPAAVTAH